MIAASLITLFFWLAVLGVGCVAVAVLADHFEERDRRRRIERLKTRRRYLDSLDPKPWTYRK